MEPTEINLLTCSIADLWEHFYKRVLAVAEVSRESRQYIEMRKAFYSGCIATMYVMLEAPELEETAAVERMESLRREAHETLARISGD